MSMILPRLLATITQHDRQRVVSGIDFNWNKDAWVHNSFRAFELVFWRRSGIRPESSLNCRQDENGIVRTVIAFHTIECALQHIENSIRTFKLFPFKIYIPMLATPQGMPVFASPYLFAIAFDNTAPSSPVFTSGTTLSTAAYTIGTTNSLIVAYAYNNGGTYVVTSVTGTDGTFTPIDNQLLSGGGFAALAYKVGSTTVSQTITMNASSAVLGLQVVSYTGASQTGQPDSQNKGTTAAALSSTIATTVVATGCWLTLATVANTQAPVAGTGATLRQRENTNNGTGLFDSGASVGTGSQSIQVTTSASANYANVVASFAPAIAAVISTARAFFTLLGVG